MRHKFVRFIAFLLTNFQIFHKSLKKIPQIFLSPNLLLFFYTAHLHTSKKKISTNQTQRITNHLESQVDKRVDKKKSEKNSEKNHFSL